VRSGRQDSSSPSSSVRPWKRSPALIQARIATSVGLALFTPREYPKRAPDRSGYALGYTEILGWGGPLFNLLKR
jgi:hypothetical protein